MPQGFESLVVDNRFVGEGLVGDLVLPGFDPGTVRIDT